MSLRSWVAEKPTAVFTFRYENRDTGEFRTISVPSPRGRFKGASEAEAMELAERRLSEQYGEVWIDVKAGDLQGDDLYRVAMSQFDGEMLRREDERTLLRRPDLDQSAYALALIEKYAGSKLVSRKAV